MAEKEEKDAMKRLVYMQALAHELKGIAFHVENTDVNAYGNKGFENGKYKLLDDGGQTRNKDVATLKKVADLFEQFFQPLKEELDI